MEKALEQKVNKQRIITNDLIVALKTSKPEYKYIESCSRST